MHYFSLTGQETILYPAPLMIRCEKVEEKDLAPTKMTTMITGAGEKSTDILRNIDSLELDPRIVITIKESSGSPKYFIKGKEILLKQIRNLVSKTPKKGTIQPLGRVVLRPDSTIYFSRLQEVVKID